MRKYALYIGRWQNFHSGHEWLISQQLDKGKNVWIAIRDVKIDENNPKSAKKIFKELQNHDFFKKHASNILLSIIPDIESVNYGRGVGYEVVFHDPPQNIAEISGTKIRKGEIDTYGKQKETRSEDNIL